MLRFIEAEPRAQATGYTGEHEGILDQVEKRLAREPEKMRIRAQTAEYPFGT